MITTKEFQIGSISHGTLRDQDLLSAFVNELEYRLRPKTSDLVGEAIKLYQDADWDNELSEDAQDAISWMINEGLVDALQELCPPFVRFGSHEGDASDFGFWPDMDSLEEARRTEHGDLYYDDNGLEFLEESNIWVEINDHGNITVYENVPACPGKVLWSCV